MNTMEFRRRSGAPALEKRGDAENGSQRLPLLTQYFSIARRRKWAILGSITASLLLGFLATMLMTPRYTASSLIEIQREHRNFTMVQGADQGEANAVDLEFYQTQYGLLEARSLAERVAASLRLPDNAQFFDMFGYEKTDEWFQDGRLLQGKSTRDERLKAAATVLLDNISIAPSRLSRLVDVSFTSPDATFSQRVVNAWGQHFIQATLERRYEATSYARQFLEQRLNQLRARIDESERMLVNYAGRQGIVNLPASIPATGEGGVSGERSLVVDDLASLNRELARATADRILAESRLGGAGGTVSEALDNQAITRLRERRAELSAEYAKMMVQFEPQYPPARALETQIEQLDRAIEREETRVGQTLRQTYQSSQAREQALQDRVASLKSDVLDLRRRSIQYNIYERDADTNRQLYDALLQRYKEIGVAGGVGVNNISVVDPAELPRRPSSPKLLLNMLLALVLGGILGVIVALALEQIDEGIADPAEVEKNLGAPLLGTIPKVAEGDPIEALQDRKSTLTEAYLSLQTNLAFSSEHGIPRTIAVTSARPAEGKTTTSYALARLLARAKRRTLLLDADMRSPSVHHLLGVANDKGLSNYLTGADDLAGLIRETAHDGLCVMVAGPQPPSAAELLQSERFERLLAELATHFDNVVVDAPPVMGLADAPLIGGRVEGAVFVLEAHGTKKSTARVAVDRLRAAHARLVGVVLTKFDVKRAHYGYGYDYGYGYGYGKQEPAKADA